MHGSVRLVSSLLILVTILVGSLAGCGTMAIVAYSHPSVDGVPALGARPAVLEMDPYALVYVAVTNDRIEQSFEQIIFPIIEHTQHRARWESPYYQSPSGVPMETPPVFVIEVLIAPANKSVSLDPARVCIRFRERQTESYCASAMREPGLAIARPSGWYVPPEQRHRHKGIDLGPICQDAFVRRHYQKGQSSYMAFDDFKSISPNRIITTTAEHPSCTALLFNIPAPDPSQSFEISLGALKVGSKDILIPKVAYNLNTVRFGSWLQ